MDLFSEGNTVYAFDINYFLIERRLRMERKR
jgi:hypothetical protein